MKANELRIGNAVGFSITNGDVTATGNGFITGCNNENVWINDIRFKISDLQGIPLTPEIIAKLPQDLYMSGFAVSLKEDEYWIDGECVSAEYKGIVKVDYVHELQDAFACLAGIELKIPL